MERIKNASLEIEVCRQKSLMCRIVCLARYSLRRSMVWGDCFVTLGWMRKLDEYQISQIALSDDHQRQLQKPIMISIRLLLREDQLFETRGTKLSPSALTESLSRSLPHI